MRYKCEHLDQVLSSVNMFNCLQTEVPPVALKRSHSCRNTVESEFASGIWILSVHTITGHCGVRKTSNVFSLITSLYDWGRRLLPLPKCMPSSLMTLSVKGYIFEVETRKSSTTLTNEACLFVEQTVHADHVLLPVFDKIFYYFPFHLLPVP